ncbi:MAG: DUF885 domain-containing protein [Xanthomonadales bacterium]|nr:DUF885 domain-containing protein [Xanthomonadales bacterium]
MSGSGRTARRGRRRTLVAVSLFALTLLAAFFWQRPPTASVLAWRVDWEERWHDPARMRAEWPWLAALRGIEDRVAPDPAGSEADHARWAEQAALASSLDCPVQPPAAREDCAVLKYRLDERIRSLPWTMHRQRLDPIAGEHLGFAALIIEQDALHGTDEAEQVLQRAKRATSRIDAWTDWMWAQRRAGIRPPHRMLEQVAAQITSAYLVEPDDQLLLQAFEMSLRSLPTEQSARRDALIDAMRDVMRSQHRPAWERLRQAVQDAAAGSPEDFGVWSMPEGDAYYRAALRAQTTLEIDPQDLYDWGRTEVDRLQRELSRLLDVEGAAPDALGERMHAWATQLQPSNVSSAPDATSVLRRFEQRMDTERTRSTPVFPVWADHAVDLRTVPASRSRAAPLALYLPRQRGVPMLQLNIRDTGDWADWSVGPLIRHEYLPGHHLQWSAQRQADLPAFRRDLNWPGFAEGWAMYAESLRWEPGAWPRSEQIALLHSELLRAVRAVVDPGLHFLRWDRSEAVRYMIEQAAISPRDAEVEVDRYLAWPGQSVSFAVGLRAFRAARTLAMQRVGSGFDEVDFARALLARGAVPLGLLPARADGWMPGAGESSSTSN